MSIPTASQIVDEGILERLIVNASPLEWSRSLGFAPADPSDPTTDANQRTRYLALIGIHQRHSRTSPLDTDRSLVVYLLDQETVFHTACDDYRTSLSLAAYNLALYRNPADLWAIWIARNSNYDASGSVDTHLMWYAAGGIEQAEEFVERSSVEDVLGLEPLHSARNKWWRWQLEGIYGGNEENTLRAAKKEVIDRIRLDKKTGMTDEKVAEYIRSSWRSYDTGRWAQSVLSEES